MSNKKKIGSVLAKAKRPSRDVKVCFRPDLVEDYQEAERAVRRDSLSNTAANAELDRIRKRMEAETVTFTLTALRRARWTQLRAEHPPREKDVDDRNLGINVDTFYPALLRESVTAPEISDAEWEQLDEVLTDGQWTKLAMTAQALNIVTPDLPF